MKGWQCAHVTYGIGVETHKAQLLELANAPSQGKSGTRETVGSCFSLICAACRSEMPLASAKLRFTDLQI